MQYRSLGRTGLHVSEIGFGAWAVGGNRHGNSYGTTDDATSIRTVQRAVDLGCTFFDTADAYGHGHSEEILGEGLVGRRDEVIIATKVGGDFYGDQTRMNFTPDYIQLACDKSLERLRTDVIDPLPAPQPNLRNDHRRQCFRRLRRSSGRGQDSLRRRLHLRPLRGRRRHHDGQGGRHPGRLQPLQHRTRRGTLPARPRAERGDHRPRALSKRFPDGANTHRIRRQRSSPATSATTGLRS